MCHYQYPSMKKAMGDFELQIIEGEFTDSEIMVMLGENGEMTEKNGVINISECFVTNRLALTHSYRYTAEWESTYGIFFYHYKQKKMNDFLAACLML